MNRSQRKKIQSWSLMTLSIYAKTRSSNFQLQQLVKGAGKIGGKVGNSEWIGNGINKNISHL